jgi:hypothetical protein
VILEDAFEVCDRAEKKRGEEPDRVGILKHFSIALEIAEVARLAIAKRQRRMGHNVRLMDLAIDGNFPQLKGEFTVAHARAAVGVARRDAIGGEDARGGDGGERPAEAMASDVEREVGLKCADGIGDFLLNELIGFAEASGGASTRPIAIKADFDVVEDGSEVLGSAAEREDGEAFVARQEGAGPALAEGLQIGKAELLQPGTELRLLAGFELEVSELRAARHEPSGAVGVRSAHHRELEKVGESRSCRCHGEGYFLGELHEN